MEKAFLWLNLIKSSQKACYFIYWFILLWGCTLITFEWDVATQEADSGMSPNTGRRRIQSPMTGEAFISLWKLSATLNVHPCFTAPLAFFRACCLATKSTKSWPGCDSPRAASWQPAENYAVTPASLNAGPCVLPNRGLCKSIAPVNPSHTPLHPHRPYWLLMWVCWKSYQSCLLVEPVYK